LKDHEVTKKNGRKLGPSQRGDRPESRWKKGHGGTYYKGRLSSRRKILAKMGVEWKKGPPRALKGFKRRRKEFTRGKSALDWSDSRWGGGV